MSRLAVIHGVSLLTIWKTKDVQQPQQLPEGPIRSKKQTNKLLVFKRRAPVRDRDSLSVRLTENLLVHTGGKKKKNALCVCLSWRWQSILCVWASSQIAWQIIHHTVSVSDRKRSQSTLCLSVVLTQGLWRTVAPLKSLLGRRTLEFH